MLISRPRLLPGIILLAGLTLAPQVAQASLQSCTKKCNCMKDCHRTWDPKKYCSASVRQNNQCAAKLWACLAQCVSSNPCVEGEAPKCVLPRL